MSLILIVGITYLKVYRFPQFFQHLSGRLPKSIHNGQNLTNKLKLYLIRLFLLCFLFLFLYISLLSFLKLITTSYKWFEKDSSL